MARFINRPLAVLHRIFRFEGEDTLRANFALTSPIQPVAEVARMAEKSGLTGHDGYFTIGYEASVNTIVKPRWDPYDEAISVAGNYTSEQLSVWVVGVGLWAESAGKVTEAGLSCIRTTGLPPSTEEMVLPIWLQDGAADGLGANVADTQYRYISLGQYMNPMPFFCPHDSILVFGIRTGAVETCLATIQLWVGPRGATPPGVA